LKFLVNNTLFQREHCNNMRNKRQSSTCAHGKTWYNARCRHRARVAAVQKNTLTLSPSFSSWSLRTNGENRCRKRETRSGTMSSLRVLKRESVRRNARNGTR